MRVPESSDQFKDTIPVQYNSENFSNSCLDRSNTQPSTSNVSSESTSNIAPNVNLTSNMAYSKKCKRNYTTEELVDVNKLKKRNLELDIEIKELKKQSCN